MDRHYYVYILTNQRNTVLYVGITNNLARRFFEHKNKIIKGFTSKYNLDKLIYSEKFDDVNEVILAEKRIKGWKRNKKIELIKSINPNLEELIIY